MSPATIANRSFFSITAWYAVIAPFVAAVIIGIGLVIVNSWHNSDSPAGFLFGTAACVLISSSLASIVCLFGIRRHGWQVIVWKSVVGLFLSCFVYFVLGFIALAEIAHQ